MHPSASTATQWHPPGAALPARNPGRALLEIERIGDRSVVTRAVCDSPLRLLAPRRCPGDAAWVFTSTFGGGLVAGDQIALDVRVGDNASCVLATQASTKVYRSVHGAATRQTLEVLVGPNATCMVLPDPLTCFAGAIFEQRVRLDLDDSASLVLVDWLTSGRRARGERWCFSRYVSRIEARVGPQDARSLVFRDAVLLDDADGPIAAEHRMGHCDCFGLVLLLGPRVKPACAQILNWANSQTVRRGGDLVFSASPIANGMLLRVAGPRTEDVAHWIRQRLAFVPGMLGGDPWARKW